MDSGSIEESLGAFRSFADLAPHVVSALASKMDVMVVLAGTRLITQGEIGDSMYVLLHGRLEVTVDVDGVSRKVGSIAAGEVVGEMALIVDEPRTASVSAIRDSNVLQLQKRDFEELISQEPQVLLAITRLIVRRLQAANMRVRQPVGVRTLALIPADPNIDIQGFASDLAATLGGSGVIIDHRRLTVELGGDATTADRGAEVTEWLHRFERPDSIVMYISTPEPSPWAARCVRQADKILLVGSPESLKRKSAIEQAMAVDKAYQTNAGVELVIVHPAATRAISGTSQLLEGRVLARHHHIHKGLTDDLTRLGRLISDRAVGVVFGGGGARGIAHIGVVKALRENKIPIDMVGGASFGGIAAGLVALGLDYESMLTELRKATVDPGSLVDFTMPAVALAKGRKLTNGPRTTFGDRRVEDLWVDFYCVSADISAGRLVVHDDGLVWKGLRASVAIPGIFPPVPDENGHVLVDGGIMDNLPIEAMHRRIGGGTIVAIDVRADSDFPAADLGTEGEVSGWANMWKRLNPFTPSPQAPRMIDILLRSTEVASGERAFSADILLRPPVAQFALLDFKSYRRIAEAGYEYASQAIADGAFRGFV